ncbi:MAG: N-acetyltransferase family protein [Roseicyclus sp.]
MSTIAKVEGVEGADLEPHLPALASLLHACVHAGASVSFVLPFAREEALAFWRTRVAPGVWAGTRRLWLAKLGSDVVGTVQLGLDTPPNQPHRAEVAKLLVHPARRRLGVASALMSTLEAEARALGRSLLTLDTRTGDAAEPLYRARGYVPVGVIPGYAQAPEGGWYEATTILYKTL